MNTKRATVTWLTGMTFDAQMGQLGQHHVMVDSAATPEESRGPGPMDLALASLAGCTAMDVVSILKKARQPFTGVVVRAEGERAEEHPKRYTRVTLVYEVYGAGVDRATVERAVALSEERYCSVSATFKQAVEIATRVDLFDVPPEAAP